MWRTMLNLILFLGWGILVGKYKMDKIGEHGEGESWVQ